MLYGCELWQLNRHDIVELEKVQNITVLGYLGLLREGCWAYYQSRLK
jgi:hypothetical protein